MSPEPIISLQRRLTLVGAIRAGGEKPERGVGRKLEAFRLTSPRRDLIEQAAVLYGGPVSPWQSPVGDEWQVYVESETLPVLVMPGYSLRQSYELWEGSTRRTRLCDGIEEEISGGPCICTQQDNDACDLYTRLVVALPELDTVLGWRLITRGANAAHELPTMLALAESLARGQTFVPARLRIDQRRGVKDGQVVRYVVPTLDFGSGYLALAGDAGTPRAALPPASSTFIPAPDRRPNVEDALASVNRERPASNSPPIGADLPPPPPLGAPEPPADPALSTTQSPTPTAAPTPPTSASGIESGQPDSYEQRRQTLYASEPQKTKLNVLVGKLREAGHITTEDLYLAIAMRLRNIEVGELIREVGGWDDEGVLHWAPLREALLRPEANQLIDWMEEKQRRVVTAGAVSERPSDPVAARNPPDPEIPY